MARGDQRGCYECGAAQRATAAFCDQCGAPLRRPHGTGPAGTRAEGETKPVTIMFVDVVGSMELSEQVGADRWRDLLDRCFALLTEAVHAFDGTIDKFTGDGVMAIFGAPRALEDHAGQACRAALRVHALLRPFTLELAEELELAVRVGLHSGEVVVGAVGGEERISYTAFGHAVGLAARMEAAAPPGRTALSAATAALVRDRFDVRPLYEALEVKGASAPQQVFELVGDRRGPTPAAHGTRFVGREAEWSVLDTALDRTLEGRGAVVGVVGAPGVGKSRLVAELERRCRAEDVAVVRAGAVAHGRRTPLLPVLDLLRSAFAVAEEDDPAQVRSRIAAVVSALSPALIAELPLLWALLGVPDPERPAAPIDPEARQRRLLALAAGLVRERARREPFVVVLEDLHWLDDASRAFLDELVRAAADAPVLVLVTYRPEFGTVLGQGEHCEQVALVPLGRGAVEQLLLDLLGRDPSLMPVVHAVGTRAAGNPFFCQELVRGLVEQGILGGAPGARRLLRPAEGAALPTTVQATIAARIDRLAPEAKQVLLVAAVIGEASDWRLLDRVSGVEGPQLLEALQALVAAELLDERITEERVEYVFRHPLVQEVAYRGQVAERRRRTHGRVVEEVVAQHGDRLDERAALLAHHAERAGRAADAAQWHARAATWAGMTTPQEAMNHWQAAKALADGLEPGPDRAGLAIGSRLGVLSQAWRLQIDLEETRRTYREVVDLLGAEQAEGHLRTLLDFAYTANLGFGGQVDEGLEACRTNTQRALALGDPALVVLSAGAHWYGALAKGVPAEGVAVTGRALEVAQGDTRAGFELSGAIDHPYGLVVIGHGYCKAFLGDAIEGLADLQHAVDLAQEEGGCEVEPLSLSCRAFVHAMLGDADAACAEADLALRTAQQRGSVMAVNAAWLSVVWSGLALGADDRTTRAAEAMLEIGRTRRVGVELMTFAHGALCEVALRAGDPSAAVAHGRRALTTSRAPTTCWPEAVARMRLSHALLALHGPRAAPQAAAHLAQAQAILDAGAIRLVDPWLHRERARVARAVGDETTAEGHEQEARSCSRSLGKVA